VETVNTISVGMADVAKGHAYCIKYDVSTILVGHYQKKINRLECWRKEQE